MSSSSDKVILKSKAGAKLEIDGSDLLESGSINDTVDKGRVTVHEYNSSDYVSDDDADDDDSEKPTDDDDDDDDGGGDDDEINIVCSDGVSIEAEPFKRESRVVQDAYEYNNGSKKVESNSEIIKVVKLFCEKRAKIQDHYAHDQILFQQKLNKFYSKFRQSNQINALHLMIAAFDLGMKSLIDLMMEDVDDMFTKMTSADEFYKIFKVNLNGQKDRKDKFEFMKDDVEDKKFGWAFENLKSIKVNIVCSVWNPIDPKYFKRESRLVQQLCYNKDKQQIADADSSKSVAEGNKNWDPELLKVPFSEFKILSPEKRRLWLTARFLLLRRRVSIVEQADYERASVSIKVQGNFQIIARVDFFCKRRAQIHDRYADDEILFHQKLNEFYSIFRKRYQIL
ncbi:uncharacterized protein [Rutidosis leptorrhynchoides]|uniref:uncharacterized protein n=1 Tax=Rutidosis leptorrhynchoides TaxID=125765 RepID=UPI003A9A4E72